MKARVNGWHIEADVVRDLASNPHRVEIRLGIEDVKGTRFFYNVDLSAPDALALGQFLDETALAVIDAEDADECDRCGRPCDPGETYCPTCEEASR